MSHQAMPRRPALRELEPALERLARAVAVKDEAQVFAAAVDVVSAYTATSQPQARPAPPRSRPVGRSGRADLAEPKLLLVDG